MDQDRQPRTFYPSLREADIVVRETAWARFAEWAGSWRTGLSAADALTSVAALWDLLPPESRNRPPDTSGVQAMHQSLLRLWQSR